MHQSFSHPGRIMVQLAATPDGTRYLSIARTVSLSAGSFLARPLAVAVGLGCEMPMQARRPTRRAWIWMSPTRQTLLAQDVTGRYHRPDACLTSAQ
ncbi:short-chain fatty acyl-CoA regulator family protein [Bradyrhizobium paxllaeri]|uniref:short-chain fatty acyl-CoA regulator family protein n=1 Tax=Bradyrhizobium paxllaeri TaxID=190148 RepID=UPI001AED1754